MRRFVLSESGAVSQQKGMSFGWIAAAVLTVFSVVGVPRQALAAIDCHGCSTPTWGCKESCHYPGFECPFYQYKVIHSTNINDQYCDDASFCSDSCSQCSSC